MTETITVIAPSVHMNGTAKCDLVDPLCHAYSKIGEAYDALKRTAPNGRDYYIIPGSLELAIGQHNRRLRTLDNLRNELENLIALIDDQPNNRAV